MAYNVIFEKLFPNLDTESRTELMAKCAKSELETLNTEGGDLYPGLDETLAYLAPKYKMFIVSNCQSGYIEMFLKSSQMEHYFDGHQCFGTKRATPKPRILKILLTITTLRLRYMLAIQKAITILPQRPAYPFCFCRLWFWYGVESWTDSYNK